MAPRRSNSAGSIAIGVICRLTRAVQNSARSDGRTPSVVNVIAVSLTVEPLSLTGEQSVGDLGDDRAAGYQQALAFPPGGLAVRNTIALVLLVTTSPGASVMTHPQDSIETIVRRLDDEERAAALARDVPALRRLWSEHFAVNAPNNQVVVGRQAVLDTFVGAGVVNFSTFERHIEFVRVDGSFVFIMGLETLVPLADAPAAGLVAGRPTKRRFTNVCKNEDGTWRLYARHANVIQGP